MTGMEITQAEWCSLGQMTRTQGFYSSFVGLETQSSDLIVFSAAVRKSKSISSLVKVK